MKLHSIMLILIAGLLPACSQTVPQVDNPIPIAVAEYDRVFDASIQVLREKRWVVDRKDRRFGVVTTEPRTAASVFEPWYTDNTTAHQTARSTLNHEQRIVRVTIEPVEIAESASAENEPGVAAYEDGEYLLRVAVLRERRHLPPRPINTAAMGSVGISYRKSSRQRALLTETGYVESHWEPVGDDPQLAKRLLADILRRSIQLDQPEPIDEQTANATSADTSAQQ